MAIKRLIYKLLSLEQRVQVPREYLKKKQSIFYEQKSRCTKTNQTEVLC